MKTKEEPNVVGRVIEIIVISAIGATCIGTLATLIYNFVKQIL